MTPQQIAALERRVADLERRLPRGTGISTAFGATEVRTMQSGFPVKLTSTFDSTTGYSWEQRVLDYDTSEVADATNPRTGAYAFTPDNDETLSVGDYGWLEPAPEAGGWILLRPGAGGGGDTTLLCEVTVSANNNHTVKEKTWSGGAIADVAGPVTYTQCRSTTATALPVGTLVSMDPIPDVSGHYWITPVAYATATLPGLVSETTQSFLGAKTFENAVKVNNAGGSGTVFTVEDLTLNALTIESDTYSDTSDKVATWWGGNSATPTASTTPGLMNCNGVMRFAYMDQADAPNTCMFHCMDYDNASTSNPEDDLIVYKDAGGTVRRLHSELSGLLYFYVANDSSGSGAAWVGITVEDGHLVTLPPV